MTKATGHPANTDKSKEVKKAKNKEVEHLGLKHEIRINDEVSIIKDISSFRKNHFVIGCSSGVVKIFDALSQSSFAIKNQTSPVSAAVNYTDNTVNYLAVAYSKGDVLVYNLDSADSSKPVLNLPNDSEVHVFDLIKLNPSNYLVSAGSDYNVAVWDLDNQKRVDIKQLHSMRVTALLELSCLGDDCFASASDDTNIVVYNFEGGNKLLKGHDKGINRLVDLNSYQKFYIASMDTKKNLRIWNVLNSACLRTISAESPNSIYDFCYVRNTSMLLASVTAKGGLNYFSIEGDKLNVKEILSTHNSFVTRIVSLRNSEEGAIVTYGGNKLNVWTI